jgi:putative addiction module component (TIGR02574 family)
MLCGNRVDPQPNPNIDSLLELDVESRLALVEKLWDSIFRDTQDGAAMPVSVEERELLDARLKEDDDDPDAAIPWAEAGAELLRAL